MTAAWWTGLAVGLDFESDSPDPEEARIITCNITMVSPAGNTSHDWMVQPERDIPEGASAVHGISTEHAREHGTPRDKTVAAIAEMLEAAGPESPVVGHNVGSYDLTLLDREMRRLGLGSLGLADGLVSLRRDGREVARFPVLDTLVLDKALDRYRPGKRQLTVVAEAYGTPMAADSAHEAGADVLASLRIAWRIASMCTWSPTALATHYASRRRPSELAIGFNGLADMPLAKMHALQTGWAATQAEGLRQYFAEHPEKGVDPAGVSGAWPFRPFN